MAKSVTKKDLDAARTRQAKEEKKRTMEEAITKLKVRAADLFMQREKLTAGLQQTNQQLQIVLNEILELEQKLKG